MRAVRDTHSTTQGPAAHGTDTALPQHAWPWRRYAQCKKLVTQGQTMSAFTCVRWWCSVTGRKQSGGFQGLLAGRWRPRAPGWARWGALYGWMRRQQRGGVKAAMQVTCALSEVKILEMYVMNASPFVQALATFVQRLALSASCSEAKNPINSWCVSCHLTTSKPGHPLSSSTANTSKESCYKFREHSENKYLHQKEVPKNW